MKAQLDTYQQGIEIISGLIHQTDQPWVPEVDGTRSFNIEDRILWRGLWRPQMPREISKTSRTSFKHQLAAQHGKHNLAGLDLVYNCANQLIAIGLIPAVLHDDLVFHEIDPNILGAIFGGEDTGGLIEACRRSRIAIVDGGLAQDSGLETGSYRLTVKLTGVTEERLIAKRSASVRAGDILIAIESSGLHCHGYDKIRELLDKEVIKLDQQIPNSEESVLEFLLRPTAFYGPALDVFINAIMPSRSYNPDEWRSGVSCIKHGGIMSNLTAVMPDNLEAVVDTNSWQLPPFYILLQETGMETAEILGLFNGGIGLVWITRPDCEGAVLGELQHQFKSSGLRIWKLGEVRERIKNRVFLL